MLAASRRPVVFVGPSGPVTQPHDARTGRIGYVPDAEQSGPEQEADAAGPVAEATCAGSGPAGEAGPARAQASGAGSAGEFDTTPSRTIGANPFTTLYENDRIGTTVEPDLWLVGSS